MRKFLYTLTQCTWGIVQTLIGLLLFVIYRKNEHFTYHGAVVTVWDNPHGSVSLGLFVFVEKVNDRKTFNRLLTHEYGHTIQSLMLGVLYPIVILIPSLMWCGLPYFKRYRQERSVSYYAMYAEKWADSLGERFAK